jgi:hypothetical protein
MRVRQGEVHEYSPAHVPEDSGAACTWPGLAEGRLPATAGAWPSRQRYPLAAQRDTRSPHRRDRLAEDAAERAAARPVGRRRRVPRRRAACDGRPAVSRRRDDARHAAVQQGAATTHTGARCIYGRSRLPRPRSAALPVAPTFSTWCRCVRSGCCIRAECASPMRIGNRRQPRELDVVSRLGLLKRSARAGLAGLLPFGVKHRLRGVAVPFRLTSSRRTTHAPTGRTVRK